MKKKILKNMIWLVLITTVLCSAALSGVIYQRFYTRMKQEVRSEAYYLAHGVEMAGRDYLNKINNREDNNRITLIGSDGTVVFDNQANESAMENHNDRQEVIDARETGRGERQGISSTLGSRTYYYAVALGDQSVLRVANTTGSVFSALLSCLPLILLIVAAVIILAVLLAREQTKKIVGPINSMNLDAPLENDVYEEISPLLIRLDRQQKLIDANMKALQEKQEEFAAITSHMQEGLIVINEKGTVLSINASAKQMLRAKDKDYINRHILTVSRNLSLSRAIGSISDGKPFEGSMIIGERQYQLMANPVFKNDRIGGGVLLLVDVTEREAREQLRKEFSANVSHELRTPLTAISGYAEIMKDGLVKPGDMTAFSRKIYQEASRLIHMVEDIIQLSRLDEGEINLPRENVDLYTLCEEITGHLTEEAGKKQVLLSVTGEHASYYGVRQLLEEMIYNLCENAIKYNREDGTGIVTASVYEDSVSAVVTVEDNGIGIPKEHQDRVFERFYRVDKSHSKETGGTGLGLSIVKHAARYHGGKVRLFSEEGKGTRVEVILLKKNESR
ncbi:sensor histidine kinase [Anaerolentibacter hominis]|uniref:sensor histidine kinase n=1 Tax=Anaerolentibacter hominis TaxID=3079009 RepID=UPI0031B84DE7